MSPNDTAELAKRIGEEEIGGPPPRCTGHKANRYNAAYNAVVKAVAAIDPAPDATAQDGEYTAAASNEAFLDAIHKATPTGQWIAVQHAPDGSGWSVALHPLPWLPGGEVAVKATPTIPAGMVADDVQRLVDAARPFAWCAKLLVDHADEEWVEPDSGAVFQAGNFRALAKAIEALAAAPKQAEQQGVERLLQGLLDKRWASSSGEWGVPDWVETDEPRRVAEQILAALNAPTGAVDRHG